MDQDQPAPLNGAQYDAMRQRFSAAARAMVDDLAKREKAVEFAIRMTAPQQHDPVELARAIHAFLTEPAAEITVTVT